jgi:chromate transporter
MLTLFASAFYISTVSFGSGYVIVSVIKKRFVDELKWIDEDEMVNLIALAQSSPGVITANTALLVGYKVCGAAGALLTVIGVALPPLITIFIISILYNTLRDTPVVSAVLKGMQAGASAVVADVVVGLFSNVMKDKALLTAVKIGIMLAAFAAVYVFGVNYVLTVLCFILLGVAWHFVGRARNGR